MSNELKKKFDHYLKERHANIQIREGYGTTECVTGSCLTPITEAKEGSIGIPFPDTLYKIVEPNTEKPTVCVALIAVFIYDFKSSPL